MQTHHFKQLDTKPTGNWMKRLLASRRFWKTVVYSFSGAVLGYVLFFLLDGQSSGVYWNDRALENVLMGLGFGILLTNNPCARNKC